MMIKTAFLFPGQGSQSVGMAGDILAYSAAARKVMDTVEDALGGGLAVLMKDGPADDLKMTRNAQPALMASALCVTRALEEATGSSLDQLGVAVAGHSLGEYAALAAAGSLDIATTARLLRQRGDAMQNAVPMGCGAMAALLGATFEQVEEIIAARDWSALDIANDNAPGQVVISGAVADVDAAIALGAEMGIRKGIKLPVSAPFHCRLMAPAADVMAAALAEVTFRAPRMPIYCNVTASEERDPEILRGHLVAQVTAMVRWRQTLLNMAASGIERFVEIGTGKVLTGLVKRSLPEVEAMNIETPEDLDGFIARL
jgi:[acyl-carrier-protein] S-malonyltransferase